MFSTAFKHFTSIFILEVFKFLVSSAEGVKALTHIGRLRPEPISETVVQAKHCPRWCEASPR